MSLVHAVTTEIKHLLKPALIISITYLGQSLIITTDIMMLGWLGQEELAAAGFVSRMYMPLFLLALGFSLPIGPLAGRSIGEKTPHIARKYIQYSIVLSMIIGLFCSIFLEYFIPYFLTTSGQEPIIVEYATAYNSIFAYSIPLFVLGSAMRIFMNMINNASILIWVGIGSVIVNAILDYVLIFGAFGIPAMGIKGAAWATIIVNIIYNITLIFICTYYAPYRRFRVFKKIKIPTLSMSKIISRMGLPMSARMICESIIFSILYFLMADFGITYLAGYQVAYQMDVNGFLLSIGVSIAVTSRIGIAKGQRDINKIITLSLAGIVINIVSLTIYALLLYIFTDSIAQTFITGTTMADTQTRTITIHMLYIIIAYQVFHGIYVIFLSIMDGLGKVTLSSIVFILLLLIFSLSGAIILSKTAFGAYGILLAIGITFIIMSLTFTGIWYYYISYYKKKFLR